MADHSPIDSVHQLREVNERLLLAGLRQHELAEKAEHERLIKTSLLESVDIGIVGFDAEPRCTSINRAAARQLDVTPGAALGQRIHDLMHAGCAEEASHPAAVCPLSPVLASESGSRVVDGMLSRRDGTCFPAMYSSHPIIVEGRTQGGVIAFSDITERKRVEESVQQTKQMEHRLEGVKLAVREVAHLLNNDLALAVGTVDLLQDDPTLTALEEAAQHLAKFQRIVRVATQETPIGLTLDVDRSI